MCFQLLGPYMNQRTINFQRKQKSIKKIKLILTIIEPTATPAAVLAADWKVEDWLLLFAHGWDDEFFALNLHKNM